MNLKTWLIKLDILLICYPLEVCLCITGDLKSKTKLTLQSGRFGSGRGLN